jgi:hypothetical protein
MNNNNLFTRINNWLHNYKLALKINRIIRKQSKIANYLNKNHILPYFAGSSEKWKLSPKQNLGTDKIIWQLWLQGINEKTPPVVHACFDSIDRYMPDYKIVRLSQNNIGDYLDLPDFVFQKINKGFEIAHFSDLLRICLLYVYGGIWMDAKLLLTSPIDKHLLDLNFFMFQRTPQPPSDEQLWEKYYAKYFCWRPNFKVNSLNSFIVAKQGYPLLDILKDILLNYWKNESRVYHYFWFQILFNEIIRRNDCRSLNCAIVNDIDVHRLEIKLKQPFTQTGWNVVTQCSSIHKLRLVHSYSQDSFYAHILTHGKFL